MADGGSTTAAAADPQRWNWSEYGAEFLGTLLMVFGGLTAVVLDFGAGSRVAQSMPDPSARLLLTGLLFAGCGSLVAISPLGKRSGAHLNPALSFAFWLQNKMHRRDIVGYVAAQVAGATAGATLLAAIWGPRAASVHDGVTLPGPAFGVSVAFCAEAASTCLLVLAILLFLSSRRTMRWTPLMVWLLVAMLVWRESPISGTSLNPARSLGPALVACIWQDIWLYVIAPPIGAALAVVLFRLIMRGEHDVLTGKLFHVSHYPSIFKNVAAPSAGPQDGCER
jgi:aquaporin Z